MARKRARKVGRPSGRNGAGVLDGLVTARDALVEQRTQVDQQIASLDQIIAGFGGIGSTSAPASGTKRGPGRPRGSKGASGHRPGSLKDVILKVMSRNGKPMAVKDIADRVVKSGYKSKNKTLSKSVGIALLDMKAVKKISRGTYALK